MTIALLLVAGLGWWLHREGVLLPNLRRLGIVAGAGLVAFHLIETGQVSAGVAVTAGAAAWWHWTRRPPAARRAVVAARALLGVDRSADPSAIHAAWRQAMATSHPDAGGTAASCRQVTAARDLLLEEWRYGRAARARGSRHGVGATGGKR